VWACECPSRLRVEFAYAWLADEPDTAAGCGEIDEVAAGAGKRWHREGNSDQQERSRPFAALHSPGQGPSWRREGSTLITPVCTFEVGVRVHGGTAEVAVGV
jgi:hypothetical protein